MSDLNDKKLDQLFNRLAADTSVEPSPRLAANLKRMALRRARVNLAKSAALGAALVAALVAVMLFLARFDLLEQVSALLRFPAAAVAYASSFHIVLPTFSTLRAATNIYSWLIVAAAAILILAADQLEEAL